MDDGSGAMEREKAKNRYWYTKDDNEGVALVNYSKEMDLLTTGLREEQQNVPCCNL